MKGALKLTQRNIDYINSLWKDFKDIKGEMHVGIEEDKKDNEWKVIDLRK